MIGKLWIPLIFVGLLIAMYFAANSPQPGTIIFPLLFIFLLTGFPIALSLAIATVIYLYYGTTIPLTAIPQKMFTNLDSFPLMAVPFFVLASNIFSVGGVAERLIRMSTAFLGHLYGGVAGSGAAGCGVFAALARPPPAP